MKTNKKIPGIKVNTSVKAGGFRPDPNHNRSGLKVASGIKAGAMIQAYNHNSRVLALG